MQGSQLAASLLGGVGLRIGPASVVILTCTHPRTHAHPLLQLNATPGKASKANKARGEMEAAADAAEAAEEHFAVLSKALKKEIRRFNKNKVLDFKNALLDAVDALIAGEDELIGCWEGLMPEVRDIGAAS